MIRSPVSPLNKALYERMKSSLIAPVYDYVPTGKKAPYVVLTDSTAKAWGTKTSSGAEVTATIKIVSEYQGDKEVAELADAVITAVQKLPLLLGDDWHVVKTSILSHTVERFDTHREATIDVTFLLSDTKE